MEGRTKILLMIGLSLCAVLGAATAFTSCAVAPLAVATQPSDAPAPGNALPATQAPAVTPAPTPVPTTKPTITSTPAPTASPSATPSSPASQTPTISQALALGSKPCGSLTVSLYSNPNPPIRGNDTFEAIITDSQGQTISDASVSFDVNMTTMNMGKNVVTATLTPDNYYTGKLFFSMDGPWRVIISVGRGGNTDTVRFDFTLK
jgi:hypothetical protein